MSRPLDVNEKLAKNKLTKSGIGKEGVMIVGYDEAEEGWGSFGD